MNTRSKIKLGLSAAALGGVALTGFASQGFVSSALAAASASAKKAAAEAKLAQKAVAKRKGEQAVQHAEAAVANDPTNAEYRALLGQSYLLAGRFASASQALSDTLTLNPDNGTAALNLALAQIGQGNWGGARTTLQTYADQIPAGDRGLGFALAGDPVTAIDILTPAAREAGATAKTRQNLALSLALAGRWKEAHQVAAMDIAPDQLQNRLNEWAKFARPANAYDQVAALLKVQPVEDAGQPMALALSQQSGVAVAAATPHPDSVDAFMPKVTNAPMELPVQAAAIEAPIEAAPAPAQIAGTGPQVAFGPREEIVQAIARPAPGGEAKIAKAAKPTKAAKVANKPARGSYYVQLGAFSNAGGAKLAWGRHTKRVSSLSDATPYTARISTRAGSFYRLSVGGFARNDADSLCRQVRAGGGSCFVRTAAGDAVASWAKPNSRTQVASR